MWETLVRLLVQKILWRRDRLPTPVFLGFPCGSAGKESSCYVGDLGSIPGLRRSLGEGKGYPLWYSGLENSMDSWLDRRESDMTEWLWLSLYRTVQLLQHYWLGHRLGLLWYWMACLETNRDHSVVFEVAPRKCISDSSVDYEGCSISSKGFLSIVVDIMVIWVKFTHSSPILVHWFIECRYSLLPSPVWPLQFILIGPNILGSYAILSFWASDFTFITSHICNWVVFLLWLCFLHSFWSYFSTDLH